MSKFKTISITISINVIPKVGVALSTTYRIYTTGSNFSKTIPWLHNSIQVIVLIMTKNVQAKLGKILSMTNFSLFKVSCVDVH